MPSGWTSGRSTLKEERECVFWKKYKASSKGVYRSGGEDGGKKGERGEKFKLQSLRVKRDRLGRGNGTAAYTKHLIISAAGGREVPTYLPTYITTVCALPIHPSSHLSIHTCIIDSSAQLSSHLTAASPIQYIHIYILYNGRYLHVTVPCLPSVRSSIYSIYSICRVTGTWHWHLHVGM